MRRTIVEVDFAGKTFDQAYREFKARMIDATMRANSYKKGRAAEGLGISIERLRRRLEVGPPPTLRPDERGLSGR